LHPKLKIRNFTEQGLNLIADARTPEAERDIQRMQDLRFQHHPNLRRFLNLYYPEEPILIVPDPAPDSA